MEKGARNVGAGKEACLEEVSMKRGNESTAICDGAGGTVLKGEDGGMGIMRVHNGSRQVAVAEASFEEDECFFRRRSQADGAGGDRLRP
ncbi:hypothetical protein HPP92_009938 [Vanilla planifolia]|uniref:Uncharacterized protein n=1 Tax=Vanilla planifolia TaxID=51239 RepID=A0A835UZM0_VANPL|nr:hypothetical protein HPP92_009938 [Vanilla planifolia]